MSDEDYEPFVGGPPPDPSERTWRHPSEIAAQAQADAAAELATSHRGLRALTAWRPTASANVLIAGSLGAAACLTIFALFQLTTADNGLGEASGTIETTEFGNNLGGDEALDRAAGATGLATTTTLQPRTTVDASFPPLSVAPIVASVANDQLVGINIGSDLVASGVLIDGYLITSASAVGNQLSISYQRQDQQALAYLVGIDPYSDLAVFRPSTGSRAGRTLEALSTNLDRASDDWVEETPDVEMAQPGDELIAITLTDDGFGASSGTVLAVEHTGITADGQPLIGLIDTTIRRPDRLGSALINASGDIVGIAVDTSSSLVSAVPIHDATAIADRLDQQGWANETWIGFIGIDQDDGVEVVQVTPAAPADNAGLRAGDVIRYLDGARVDHMGGITAGLRRAAPGDTIVMVVQRSDELTAISIQVMAYGADIAEQDSTVPIVDDAEPLSEPVDG